MQQPALWFLFRGFQLLVNRAGETLKIPLLQTTEELNLKPIRTQYMGALVSDGRPIPCFCGEIEISAAPPPNYEYQNLRPLFAQIDETSFWLAGRAVQLVDWDRTHLYCGHCGRQMVNHENDRAKVCPHCGLTNFPILAPAIIVRVQRLTENGPEILLARAKRFPTSMFSVLAGFVEPGETLEECVQREIEEEVGIKVKDIQYFGSQPWPFPHSLMIAFTANHEEGELAVDPNELAEAAWFPRHRLPNIPPPPSIANQLIENWVASIG